MRSWKYPATMIFFIAGGVAFGVFCIALSSEARHPFYAAGGAFGIVSAFLLLVTTIVKFIGENGGWD